MNRAATGWSLLACALACIAMLAALQGRLEFACAAWAFGAFATFLGEQGRERSLLVLALACCLPFLGPAAAGLLRVGELLCARGTLVEDYLDYVSDRMHAEKPLAASPPVIRALVPLSEIISSNASDGLKRGAIESLARLETPRAMVILRSALSHPSVETRFYAAGALERLEQRLADRYHLLERVAAIDRAGDSGKAYDFARACFDYAAFYHRGDSRRDDLLAQALEQVQMAHVRGGGTDCILLMAEILLGQSRAEEAVRQLDSVTGTRRADQRVCLLLARALFVAGHRDRLITTCRELMHDAATLPAPWRSVIEEWSRLELAREPSDDARGGVAA